MRKDTLVGLTSIRFFAAMWVVFTHLRWGWKLPELIDRFFDAGYSGVTLFFILSGFILSYNYLPREFTQRDFWSARIARILPVYFFALLVSFPLSAGFAHRNGQSFFPGALPALFLMQAWIPQSALTWNWPGWSLSVEAFFYLLFPFLLRPFARLAKSHAAIVLGAAWLLSLIPSTLYALTLPEGPVDTASRSVGLTVIKFDPLIRLPEFLIGIALGALYLNGARIPRPRLAAAGCVLALAFIVLGPWRLPYPAMHNGLLAPIYGLLILALASEPRMLANPILELLGESSYSLYLLHASVIVGCGFIAGWLQWHGHGSVALASAAIAVVVSIASYKFIEVPARRFIRSRLMPAGFCSSRDPIRNQ
jgi:peptidoglycan/LPS O-acetylase OafA/YrhL